jgi:hypothetical protein
MQQAGSFFGARKRKDEGQSDAEEMEQSGLAGMRDP